MKFLRKPKPEEKGEGIERHQADLSNILASLTMRLEQVERRLDALEGAPRPKVVIPPPPPALPKVPVSPRPKARVLHEVTLPGRPRQVALKPARPKAKRPKPKPRLVKPPEVKPPKPAPPVRPRAELKVRLEKLEPVKLTRGKTIKPFKKED